MFQRVSTFRIGQSNLFASPKTKIRSLKLLRHQSVELLRGTETRAHLEQNITSVLLQGDTRRDTCSS